MTSGEWDLRALKALEEEELAQLQVFSKKSNIEIPPPPQLPAIQEYCGSLEYLNLASNIPLPNEIPKRIIESSFIKPSTSFLQGSQDIQYNHQILSNKISKNSLPDNMTTTMIMFLSSGQTSSEINLSDTNTTNNIENVSCTSNLLNMDVNNCDADENLKIISAKKRLNCKSVTKGDKHTGHVIDYELEDHIKHCSCSCNHMGYGNSLDYQTTTFGGLPDVTEHSNIRHTISRQGSFSNSESADLSSLQKSKEALSKGINIRKNFIFSLSVIVTLILCATISVVAYQYFALKPNRYSYDSRIKIVQKILQEVPLIDGHNDLAWNIRKYAHNSLEFLDFNFEIDHGSIWHRPVWSQTDIKRLKKGLIGAQIWSAYVPCEAQGLDAVQVALEQIDIIHRLTEIHSKDLSLVVSSQEILQSYRNGKLASMIGIGGGYALGSSLGVLRSMHSLGARYVTLTHHCDTTWAGSSSSSMGKGLSSFGKSIIKEMNRLGMLIDLSYSSDKTAKDVLELTRAPIIFSHSAARTLCNSSSNIPDDIIRAVADNGGLIMVSFNSELITCDDSSTLQDVIAHIKYIRSIAGIEHIGIGAGYDSIKNPPIGLEDVSKYPNLFSTLLEDSNWSEDDIGMLAGKNFLRVFKSVENVRDYWKRAAIPPVEDGETIKVSQCTYMSS